MTEPHRCGNCGTTWRHSDRVGCCSACKQTFASLGAFDAHQVGPRNEQGRLTCLNAATATYSDPDGKRYGQRVFSPSQVARQALNGPLWGLASTAAGRAYFESRRKAKNEGTT